jgi:hypothetical protein
MVANQTGEKHLLMAQDVASFFLYLLDIFISFSEDNLFYPLINDYLLFGCIFCELFAYSGYKGIIC